MEFYNITIPEEAVTALNILKRCLAKHLAGVYLYGSAVIGGLRPDSDVDILALTDCGLPEITRKDLTASLMEASGRVGNPDGVRPLEVTVVNLRAIRPGRFPPRFEMMYGEWLRKDFEQGVLPRPADNPDLAILLAQARESGVALLGAAPAEVLEPVPRQDIRRAIAESLPGLTESLKGDERNVILTLARMWFTVSTGAFCSKDAAAAWAMPQLPPRHAALLDLAGKAYLGECEDHWEALQTQAASLAECMKKSVESMLGVEDCAP